MTDERSLGLIVESDIDTTRLTYEEARFALSTSRAEVAISESDLLFACGYPSDI